MARKSRKKKQNVEEYEKPSGDDRVMLLPDHCFRNEPLSPKGFVFHFIKVDPDNPAVIRDAVIDPYGAGEVYSFLNELNLPGEQRGSILVQSDESRAYGSYQIFIDRKGIPYTFVEHDKQAYHAGESEWKGLTDLNRHYLGVAFAGGFNIPFTKPQYDAAVDLCQQFGFSYSQLVGHQHVAIPKGRKVDPGPSFSWDLFKRALR